MIINPAIAPPTWYVLLAITAVDLNHLKRINAASKLKTKNIDTTSIGLSTSSPTFIDQSVCCSSEITAKGFISYI